MLACLVSAFGLSVLTGIIFGLAPALQSTRLELTGVLKEGGRNTSGSVSQQSTQWTGHRRKLLMAVVLLVGAGMLLKSLVRVLRTDPGFNPENVLTMTVVLPAAKYAEAPAQSEHSGSNPAESSDAARSYRRGTVNILPLQPGNTTRVNVKVSPFRRRARNSKRTSAPLVMTIFARWACLWFPEECSMRVTKLMVSKW